MKTSKLAILAVVAAAVPLNSASAASIWTAGHGDLGIGYEAGELEPHWHLGEEGEEVVVDGATISNDPDGFEYGPDELIATTSLSAIRSTGSQWDYIGVSANGTYYLFPQVADLNTPWVGIGTEELDPADWTGSLTLTLTGITGPAGGKFSLYQTDSFGDPTFFMSTNDGVSGADAVSLAAGGHEHHNWTFTEQGSYDLTFDIAGTHAVDGAKTATATYTFSVIPEPSAALLGAFGALGLMRRRR